MSQSVGSREDSRQLPLLTGLRGFAAGVVVISHAANIGFIPSVFGHGFGQVGVMIFFVLSGFLMSHLYIQREPNRRNILSYARGRVGRVIPLYVIVVLISIVVSNSFYTDFEYSFPFSNAKQILEAAFLVKAPSTLWTIPVEVQFYLAFAIGWLLHPRIGKVTLVLAGGFVLLPLAIYFGLVQDMRTATLPTFGFAFFLGAATALFFPQVMRYLSGRVPGFLGGVFVVMLLLNLPELRNGLGLSVSSDDIYISTWLDPVTWFVVYGLFLCCLLVLPSLKWFDSRPFLFLGNISYGLYLLHFPILGMTARLVGTSPLGLVVAICASVSVAWLSFRYFEVPAMALIRGRPR